MLKQKLLQLTRYKKIQAFYVKYERLLMPGTLVFGFVVDAFTFKAIEIRSAFLLLAVHIVLVGSAILYITIYDAGRIKGMGRSMLYVRYGRLLAPFLLQLSIGALLSAAFIFYLFGSVLSVSWPLLAVVLLLALSNEIFKEYYLRPSVQISVYFFAVFTVVALVLPYIFGVLSVWLFLLAGGISIAVMILYIKLLAKLVPAIHEIRLNLIQNIVIILFLVLGMYFVNVIPPLPLTLRDGGVYHSIERLNNVYTLEIEQQSWMQRVVPGETIHITPGAKVYVFSSIYAPESVGATIAHHWQLYDEQIGEWQTMDRLNFFVQGGRQQGFRGYTFKTVVPEGEWRVDVETLDGRIFGRVTFDVEHVAEKPATELLTQ